MKHDPDRHARVMEGLRRSANSSRDTADGMAAMFEGCDDPLHPFMGFDPQPFRDWHDFTDRVCRPIVADETSEAELQAAMVLYRKANPHFIAVSLVMALNRIRQLEAETMP